MTGQMDYSKAKSTPALGYRQIKLPKLKCGHQAVGPPPLSNPRRWWCCGRWQGRA